LAARFTFKKLTNQVSGTTFHVASTSIWISATTFFQAKYAHCVG